MKNYISFLGLLFISNILFAQRDTLINKGIYKVLYSQKLQQPIWISYQSINRPTNVNRGAMDFYTERGLITSDAADYSHNRYDKGHGAPAATFSDNMDNLKTTFSYLNCMLQWDELNRGQWKQLEETERIWDNSETLTIEVEPVFKPNPIIKGINGATIPNSFKKHIYFTKQNTYKCYEFPNQKLNGVWGLYQIKCDRHRN